jgi:hypothetical protein
LVYVLIKNEYVLCHKGILTVKGFNLCQYAVCGYPAVPVSSKKCPVPGRVKNTVRPPGYAAGGEVLKLVRIKSPRK